MPPRSFFVPSQEILRKKARLLIEAYRKKGASLSLAESCTAGGIASLLGDIPGASDVLLSGLVTYSNSAKERLLFVDAQMLASYGAVSQQVACAMFDGLSKVGLANRGLAVTGIAGPRGGSKEKPVGTVWIAWGVLGEKCQVRRCFFPFSRAEFKRCVLWEAMACMDGVL